MTAHDASRRPQILVELIGKCGFTIEVSYTSSQSLGTYIHEQTVRRAGERVKMLTLKYRVTLVNKGKHERPEASIYKHHGGSESSDNLVRRPWIMHSSRKRSWACIFLSLRCPHTWTRKTRRFSAEKKVPVEKFGVEARQLPFFTRRAFRDSTSSDRETSQLSCGTEYMYNVKAQTSRDPPKNTADQFWWPDSVTTQSKESKVELYS